MGGGWEKEGRGRGEEERRGGFEVMNLFLEEWISISIEFDNCDDEENPLIQSSFPSPHSFASSISPLSTPTYPPFQAIKPSPPLPISRSLAQRRFFRGKEKKTKTWDEMKI